VDEVVENEPALEDGKQSSIYYAFRQGTPVLNAKTDSGGVRTVRSIDKRGLKLDQSILSQRRDPESYPELTYLGDRFAEMAFFRELYLGRSMAPRHPQKTDLPTDWLLEDGVNLALVLNDMFNSPQIKEKMLSHLKEFYEGIVDVTLKIQGGTVQVFVHEVGLHHPIPAERLSDGTLRYLCLLAVLCHPEPPPVVCIEEPELGLHPDIVMKLAPLLLEAATRTQLFVTTHSDVLVDALSEVPEAVVVCERGEKGSTLHRLDRGLMQAWLEDHHLGELWVMGEIGGNPR
jgi:predicted ATPase